MTASPSGSTTAPRARLAGQPSPVTTPHADFHGSTRLALDDSLNRYVLQGRIVERNILNDSGYSSAGSTPGPESSSSPAKVPLDIIVSLLYIMFACINTL